MWHKMRCRCGRALHACCICWVLTRVLCFMLDASLQIYKTSEEAWEELLAQGEQAWYGAAEDRWASAEASVSGVLAGALVDQLR